MGRIFVIKMEHGDNLFECLKRLVKDENVKTAVFFIIGALKDASIVVGPREPVLPPDPVWKSFDDGREIAGIGTVYRDEKDEPAFHIHTGIGKDDQSLVGCLREKGEVYITVEVMMIEIEGIEAVRQFDSDMGLKMLAFLK